MQNFQHAAQHLPYDRVFITLLSYVQDHLDFDNYVVYRINWDDYDLYEHFYLVNFTGNKRVNTA